MRQKRLEGSVVSSPQSAEDNVHNLFESSIIRDPTEKIGARKLNAMTTMAITRKSRLFFCHVYRSPAILVAYRDARIFELNNNNITLLYMKREPIVNVIQPKSMALCEISSFAYRRPIGRMHIAIMRIKIISDHGRNCWAYRFILYSPIYTRCDAL